MSRSETVRQRVGVAASYPYRRSMREQYQERKQRAERVMRMSDHDLQCEVALILGASNVDTARSGIMMGYWPEKDKGGDETGWELIPNYPEDIAAAWELAEKAKLSVLWSFCDEKWWAGRTGSDAGGDWWFESESMIDASAPRAITRAFVFEMSKEK
jgi:hypothetical protein